MLKYCVVPFENGMPRKKNTKKLHNTEEFSTSNMEMVYWKSGLSKRILGSIPIYIG
jgi:hypothetical protein